MGCQVKPGSSITGQTLDRRPISGGTACGAVHRAGIAAVIGEVVIGIGIANRNTITSHVGSIEPSRGFAGRTFNSSPIGSGVAGSAVSRAGIAGVVSEVVIGGGVTDRDSITSVGRQVEPGRGVTGPALN